MVRLRAIAYGGRYAPDNRVSFHPSVPEGQSPDAQARQLTRV